MRGSIVALTVVSLAVVVTVEAGALRTDTSKALDSPRLERRETA